MGLFLIHRRPLPTGCHQIILIDDGNQKTKAAARLLEAIHNCEDTPGHVEL
jgi:hypothetical protein